MAEIRLQIHKNQHQITPAVVNAFQANNLVDNLVFTMANYTDGDTDFSKMTCYAVCYGVLGIDEIILPTRINDAGELEITWTLDSYTLSIGQNIYYQIAFKDANAAVLTTYKAVILCNESIPADEHIVAQYPTILKQIEQNVEINITNLSNKVDGKLDDMMEMVNGAVASDAYYLMNHDEPIPLDQRANGKLYLQRLNDYDYSCVIEDYNGTILKPSASGISFDAGSVGSSATNVQTFLEELHSQAKGRTRFCVNEGNVDEEGSADLLGEISSERLLVVKSGGEYKNIIATKANGVTFECGEIPSVDCSGYPTGDYNVFLSEDSTISLLKNNVHTEPLEPQYPEINDVWHDVVNREAKIYLEFEEALKHRNSNYSVTFNDVAVNGDVCVVASNGGIYTSVNRGATWKNTHIGNYQCVIYANNMFVAAGANGNVATSLDGLTWVTKAKHGTDTIYNMIYDGTRYCAVTRANRVKYSESLDSWTTTSIITGFMATDIDYHDGLYMVCDSYGEICMSGDGETWVSSMKQLGNKYTKIRHLVDQTWVALMEANSGMMHYTNDNGASWGTRAVNKSEIVTDIQYLDGEYTLTTTTNVLKGASLDGLIVVPNSENSHYTSIDNYVVVGSSGAIGTIGADIGWYTFDQVPIGSVYIYSGGGIDGVYTNPYNNNGYDVTTYTVATPATYGVMRVAAPMDEVNCSCTDAGITPSNLYKINDFRIANTKYNVGDTVACPYYNDIVFKCVTAGTTSNDAMILPDVLVSDKTITDGTVVWKITHVATTDDALNKTQITNCILSVEELVKVSANETNGQLVLKKGSIVYVSTNGTFNEVTIQSDIGTGSTGLFTNDGRRDLLACYVPSLNEIRNIPIYQTYSQATAPTASMMLNSTYCGWFDTTNNIMKYTYDGGSTWTVCSLPFAWGNPMSISASGKGWGGKIKEVFNGFGFFGQHTFVTRGVKALLSNGKNTDETLKNKEVVSTRLSLNNTTGRSSWICFFDGTNILDYGVNEYFEQDEVPTDFSTSNAIWLNTKENVMYSTSDSGTTWTKTGLRCYLGKLRKNGGTGIIENFVPNKPVELVKRTEFVKNVDKINSNIDTIETNITNLTNNKITVDNSSMVVSSAGVLCKLGDRNFYKRNEGWTVCALVYFQSGYGGPILIGKTPESVKQYNDYDTTDSTIGGSFVYKGTTYYYSAHNSSMPISASIYKPFSYPIFTKRSESSMDMAKRILLQYYSSTNFAAPVNSYLNDMLWYDVWGSGKIECGGIYEGATLGKEFAITFPLDISKVLNIKFTNYQEGVNSQFHDGINIKSISSTGFVAFVGSIGEGSHNPSKIMWEVKGYK